MRRITSSVAIAVAIAATVAILTTHGVAAQDEQGGGGRRAAPAPPKPGAPEPIVGGTRPPIIGSSAGVSAGHPLTSAAAMEVLLRGGNAFDAGVAALLVGGVVEQDLYSLGGEALVLVYPVVDKHVTSVVGQGWAPKGASIEYYKAHNKTLSGEGLDPSVVPGAMHSALTVLEKWGTMSFEQVSARAIQYAEHGFPLRPRTANSIRSNLEFFKAWPDNQRYWLKADGSMYLPGETIALPTLANTMKKMVEAERKKGKRNRAKGVAAARDRFYKGDIAETMVAFLKQHGAPYELGDFSEFYARVEEPVSTTYKGYTIYKQGFNSQGPSLLQTLNILENFDLRAMGHDTPDYIHTVIEAMKLTYADRDTYYGDPTFVKTPAEGLLSKEYAKTRAALIDPKRSSRSFVAGDPLPFDSQVKQWAFWRANDIADQSVLEIPMVELLASNGIPKDTTHISVIDKDGNMFDSTPSGGWIGGAVILGDTGVAMSVRGEQFWLDESRAAQLRPRARPRYTLTPSLILKDDKPFMALGTPGGDNQEQTILQAFLNIVEFWDDWYPNLHTAFAWPRFQTMHFYGSVWPHRAGFNRMNIEAPIAKAVVDELKKRGHDISEVRQYGISGCATGVMIDPTTHNRLAAADARRDCYAMGY
jgi:gamma-glutamyltranspeptidase/glutathione hydrolase